MTIVRDVIESMEKWAPSQTAEIWDNVGLQTGNDKQKIKSILITLDITWETLERTRKLPFPMIISHHPLIFKPLKKLTSDNNSNKLIIEALSKNIPIFSSHTNLDIAHGGVSHALAKKIGLENISTLIPGNISLCKFVTFVPPEYTDRIIETMSSAGAGNIGNYSYCSFTVNGTSTFLPNESAKPFTGSAGNISKVSEDRIEMVVPAFSAAKVLDSLRKIHPYEEMAYDIIPLTLYDRLSGYGAIGTLKNDLEAKEFLTHVSSSLEVLNLTHSITGNGKIRKLPLWEEAAATLYRTRSYQAPTYIYQVISDIMTLPGMVLNYCLLTQPIELLNCRFCLK